MSFRGNAASNSLASYGLTFGQLNMLHEYGLIIADYNSYMDYRVCIADEDKRVALAITYQNRMWGLAPASDRPKDTELRLHGVALSSSGKELMEIVDIEPAEEYTSALQEYFEMHNLKMVEITKQAS